MEHPRKQGRAVRRALLLCALAMAGWCVTSLRAQRSAAGVLAVRVDPEAHLHPPRATLRFVVPEAASPGTLSQTVPVSAWVRALPHQRIRLTASIPAATLPPGTLAWAGARTRATGGAQSAACTSGTFRGAADYRLADNWNRSGLLTCAVTFSLVQPEQLTPGTYIVDVDFHVSPE